MPSNENIARNASAQEATPRHDEDAADVLGAEWDKVAQHYANEQRKAAKAKEATLVRRAAKEIDRSWGHKMAPACPHCRKGLMPQDFADGVRSASDFDYEMALRKRALTEAKAGGAQG